MNLSGILRLPWLLLFLGSFPLENVSGAKILAISFMSSKSHKITYEPLLRELARRGHEVTAIGPIKSKDEKNFKNIQTFDPEELYKKDPNFFDIKLALPAWVDALFNPYLLMGGLMGELCQDSYKLPQVRQVLNEKWDMVFFTPLFNECLYGLVHKLNTTTVIYSQITVSPWIADNLGSPNPPSHVSSFLVGYDERMNFRQRLFNTFRSVYDWAIMNLYYNPTMERVYRTALEDPTIPCIKEIERNASIVLMNCQISFCPPKPLLPDIIEVGGMHLVPSKPVEPKVLDDFLRDQPSNMLKAAKKGFALPPLEFGDLTEEILLNAINEALDNPSYAETAKRLSNIFRDQQTKPLDRGVFWVEYVLRHKGAVHLRSAARDLNYIQYFSLDTLAGLLVILVASITINVLILRVVWRKCFGSKSAKINKAQKKKQ
ncbi:unnamed protein product [Allacma fusca]|uniref:UDP-glucuronosyltransferase n=1 Tax=Allacma fusca TaxID=39272 RepID=A0A8J2PZ45_9HEXA|nr:unnamed protein product [Allacma fusca]